MVEQPTTATTGAIAAFQATQRAFAAHIRDPVQAPRPTDIEVRRMAIYRDLFFGNIEGLLAGTFRVTKDALGRERWRALVRDFMVHHRARSPLFAELAGELLDYLGTIRVASARDDPPYLLELAHFEWVKWALKVSDDEPDPRRADPNGDLFACVPVVSPLARVLSYRFAVHRLDPADPPRDPLPVSAGLIVYRDRADRVEVLEINPVTQRLLALLQAEPPRTGQAALGVIATELAHPRPEAVVAAGATMLGELRRRDVLIGTRRDQTKIACSSISARQTRANSGT